MTQTPHGDTCVSLLSTSPIAPIIMVQAHGTWQREVAMNLISSGYVIGYKATSAQLHGKARSYNSHYARSLSTLMDRITNAIRANSQYRLISGPVGPKGALGYYLVD